MEESDIAPFKYGDLLRYLGIWLLMSTFFGWKRGGIWSVTPFDPEANPFPYRMGGFMSKLCFNAITRELRFTNNNPPPYVDKFWNFFQMVKACNYHMTSIFLVSYSIFLDKSVSIWHIRLSCPVWIFCTWKNHQFCNEWHTASCEFSDIFFVVELVEGKSHPLQDVSLEFGDIGGKTVFLLLHMMKSYFDTGRYVILDSGLCVFKWFIELRMKVFFACAAINKRRYCPSMVPGK